MVNMKGTHLPTDMWNCIIGNFAIDRTPSKYPTDNNVFCRIVLHNIGLVSKQFLQLVKKQFRPGDKGKLYEHRNTVMNVCADHGWVNLLNYFKECKRFELTYDVANHGARHGHINVLEYCLREKCPMRATVADNATLGGHLECLKYALNHRVVAKPQASLNACEHDSVECLEYLHPQGSRCDAYSIAKQAAEKGAIKCLKWAVSRGAGLDESVLSMALRSDSIEMVQFVFENSCGSWSDSLQQSLLWYGNMEMIEFAAKTGIEWAGNAYYYAARGGKFDTMKFLHQNGVKIGRTAVEGAVEGGNVDCMKFLIDNGFQPNPNSLEIAVRYVRLDMAKLLRERGLEWPASVLPNLVHSYNTSMELLTYAVATGYIWDPTRKCWSTEQINCSACERVLLDVKRSLNLK
jgi:hypothetical protein